MTKNKQPKKIDLAIFEKNGNKEFAQVIQKNKLELIKYLQIF